MMARRVELQFRWDWDLNPGLHSLSFASKVNKSVGIALRKGLRKLEDANEEQSDTNIGLAMKRLYEMLQDGEYKDDAGDDGHDRKHNNSHAKPSVCPQPHPTLQ